ncbi:MAG TPA: polysaccharide deacetylase family protein [Streptosporangiaceae bacterium]|nr:polysaccharide deacetylase family protein [Streptosporangiaceae bacterium]
MTDLVDSSGQRARQAGLRVPVLMYHEISTEPAVSSWLAAAPGRFAQQLEYLRGSGYHALTAGELASALKSGTTLPAKPVVLTFDDGTADFYEIALPLLAEHGFTATLFATSGWMTGKDGRACCRKNPPGMLSWDQLRTIAGAGIEIGAHSVTHPPLDQLPPDPLRRELADSKAELESQLGRQVPGVAYPFGYSSRLVRACASGAGYEYGCVVGNRLATADADPYALPRLTIARTTRLPGFARTVAAQRLPVEFAGYRLLTLGWSAVRKARNRTAR